VAHEVDVGVAGTLQLADEAMHALFADRSRAMLHQPERHLAEPGEDAVLDRRTGPECFARARQAREDGK